MTPSGNGDRAAVGPHAYAHISMYIHIDIEIDAYINHQDNGGTTVVRALVNGGVVVGSLFRGLFVIKFLVCVCVCVCVCVYSTPGMHTCRRCHRTPGRFVPLVSTRRRCLL